MDIIKVEEMEIRKLAKEYNLRCKLFDNNKSIHIASKAWNGDESWVATVYDEYVELRHINKSCNKKAKGHSHMQRRYSKLEHCFDSISKHKPKFKKLKQFEKMNRMKMLFEQVI